MLDVQAWGSQHSSNQICKEHDCLCFVVEKGQAVGLWSHFAVTQSLTGMSPSGLDAAIAAVTTTADTPTKQQ
jgi:hypothetical protein